MAMLHVVDRPAGLHANPRSHGVGAAAAAATHLLIAAGLMLAFRAAPADVLEDTVPFSARLVWPPNITDGGGHQGGGDRSSQPARPVEARGTDSFSVPSTPQPSAASLADVPVEPIMLAAQPMGHSPHMLQGAVSSDSPATAPGRDTGPGGDGDGPAAGDGSGPRGFGDGLKLGGPGVTTPVVVLRVTPQYTTDAMRAKVQGVVWLECIVLPDGTVGDVRIARSLDSRFGLDDAAIAAARQWRFKPGLMNGQPVPVAVTIELTFTLR